MKMLSAALLLFASTVAHAGVLNFYTTLAPEGAGGRTGSGSARISFDDTSNVLSFSVDFAGLSGLTTQAHFHCCTAQPFLGTAGIAVDSPSLPIPTGVSAGSFSGALDLDDAENFNATFLAASGGTTALATARFIENIYSHRVYLNIHSTTFTGGEIRGFLVPEPTSAALALLALTALGALGRKQRQA